MTIEEKLAEFGHTLSQPPAPAANYIPVTRTGNLIFISGQVSAGQTGVMKGHLGRDHDVPSGQKAAALCAVNLLAQLKFSADIPLDKVRFLKLTVLVASMPHFNEQHLVANGASDLLVAVLGDNGRHARAAFGVAALPLNAAVEIDAVAEIID